MRALLALVAVTTVALAVSGTALSTAVRTHGSCESRVVYFAGSVIAKSADSLTVEVDHTGLHDARLGGRRVVVQVTGSTGIVRDGEPISLSAIRDREHVAVSAVTCSPLRVGRTLVAQLIRAGDRDVFFAGSVVSRGPNSLTVEVDRTGLNDGGLGGRKLTVYADQQTKISRDGQPILLSDIRLDEHVAVRAEDIAGKITANTIRIA